MLMNAELATDSKHALNHFSFFLIIIKVFVEAQV